MGKVNELLQLIEELNRCGNTLIDISEELKNLFSGSEEDSRKTEAKTKTAEKASKEEKTISLEDVRAVMADKSRKRMGSKVHQRRHTEVQREPDHSEVGCGNGKENRSCYSGCI